MHIFSFLTLTFFFASFLFILQTPSVESDSNFISNDQMSIVKKEFGKEWTETKKKIIIFAWFHLTFGVLYMCHCVGVCVPVVYEATVR